MYTPRFAYGSLLMCSCAVFLLKFTQCYGKPMDSASSIDRFDYTLPYNQPLSEYGLHRLRRGYYYVDNGYITAVPEEAATDAQRRSETNGNDRIRERSTNGGGDRGFDSVLRYRETHASRKKLFVPNLFG